MSTRRAQFVAGIALALALVLGPIPAVSWAALALPPAPTRWVTDQAGFLSPGAARELDLRLEAYERQTGHQVLVWIGRSTGGEPIENWAVKAFAAWRVGRKGIDDGLALFLFAEDRKIRIEVGYGLEGVVTDFVAAQVIREAIAPRLLAGDRDGAVRAAIDVLTARIEKGGGAGPPPGAGDAPSRPGAFEILLFGIIALGFLFLLITNPSLAIYLLLQILSGGRGGRGGGFSGSGGGGFSGGGGRSGGGGASGSW